MSTFEAALRAPYLSVEEERAAIRAWQEDEDRDALACLLKSHARQAWSHARKWTNDSADLDDLVAEGMVALIEAVNKFDLKRDVRFSTYAIWFVKNHIFEALTKIKAPIDVPTRTYLDARAGRLPPEKSAQVIAAVDNTVPVNPSGSGDIENATVLLCREKTPEETVSEKSTKDQVARLLDSALQRLDPVEQVLIRRRLEDDPKGDADVARALKVSQTQLRSIERRAMHRLRHALQERGFGFAMLEQ